MDFRQHIFEPAFARTGAFGNDRLNFNHGTNIATNDEEVDAYVVAYAPGHYHKLRDACAKLNLEALCRSQLEIIDWGCGPALASWAFLSEIVDRGVDIASVRRVTLIDPSWPYLMRGTIYLLRLVTEVGFIFQNFSVANKTFGQLASTDIVVDPGRIKVHLFSNILDMHLVDLNVLHQLIVANSPGYNLIIASSPRSMDRIQAFFALFEGTHGPLNQTRDDTTAVNCWRYVTNTRSIRENDSVYRFEKMFVVNIT